MCITISEIFPHSITYITISEILPTSITCLLLYFSNQDGSLVSGESDKKNGKKLNHFEISHPTDLAAAYHYDKVVGVIKKDTSERSDAEIHQIISWFKKKSDLFNQLNESKFQRLSLYLSLRLNII